MSVIPESLINLSLYDLRSSLNPETIDNWRHEFAEQGGIVLPDFVSLEGRRRFEEEADSLVPRAHRQQTTANILLREPDPAASGSDPRGFALPTSIQVVPYDLFLPTGAVNSIYLWINFQRFLADLLSLSRIYPYEDPLGAINLVRMSDGDVQGWHFDMTDFVVTISVRAPASGGYFEMYFVDRNDLSSDPGLSKLLRGHSVPSVRRLDLPAGSLALFRGRETLHRVSPVCGDTPRDVLLFGFDTRPGADSTTENKLRRYGRVGPAINK